MQSKKIYKNKLTSTNAAVTTDKFTVKIRK